MIIIPRLSNLDPQNEKSHHTMVIFPTFWGTGPRPSPPGSNFENRIN